MDAQIKLEQKRAPGSLPVALVIICSILPFVACATGRPLVPPRLDHSALSEQFFKNSRQGHYALTVEHGNNTEPSLTDSNIMFYTMSREGSRDIWMRELNSTLNIPFIKHDAEQHSPAVTPDGRYLVFVSEDVQTGGELRIIRLKNQPEKLIQSLLKGSPSPNYWHLSSNLSAELSKLQNKSKSECSTIDLAESDPTWSPTGKYLFFTSNRCSGLKNIWVLEQSETEELQNPPRQLTTLGGEQPSSNQNGSLIAFIAYREASSRGDIYLLDRNNNYEVRLNLPQQNSKGQRVVYSHPTLSFDGKFLYYISYRQDSNQDGEIDTLDNSTLYRINLTGWALNSYRPEEIQLLDSKLNLQHIRFTNFANGSLLYTINTNNQSKIYYLPEKGVITLKKDIAGQYRLLENYRRLYPDRLPAALDSFSVNFGESPEYIIYEGLITAEKLRIASQHNYHKSRQEQLNRKLNATYDRNPFARLQQRIHDLIAKKRSPRNLLENFYIDFEKVYASFYSREEQKIVLSRVMTMLAQTLHQERQSSRALQLLNRLNTLYPEYPGRTENLILNGEITLSVKQTTPEVFSELLKSDLDQEFKDKTIQIYFNHLYENRTSDSAMQLIQTEIKNKNSHPLLQKTLLLARARVHFDLHNYEEAYRDAARALRGVKAGTGLYLRGWRLIADIHDKLGQQPESHAARIIYANSYYENSNVNIDSGQFQNIIDETERVARHYIKTAEAMTEVIDSQLQSSISIQLLITGNDQLKLPTMLQEELASFCSADSNSYQQLEQTAELSEDYRQFCQLNQKLNTGATQPTVPVTHLERGVELHYMAAYTVITRLNELFTNLRRVNLFPELYREQAIRYHSMKIDFITKQHGYHLKMKQLRIKLPETETVKSLFELGDPFDSQEFALIEKNYRLQLKQAQALNDYAALYGFAYLLIHKTIQRELVYDALLSADIFDNPDPLRRLKTSALRDLKEAENYLKYLLHLNIPHTDAALLLGWMYQYIDERRSTRLKIKPNIADRAINYLTGTTSGIPTDGNYYKDLYLLYFPDRLFETNVEIYNQSITEATRTDNSMALANLRLNLANNYFKLSNYKSALREYEHAARLFKLPGVTYPGGYTQEALHFYNYGRALFYEGRATTAANIFQISHSIYLEREYQQRVKELQALQYKSSALKLHGDDLSNNQLLKEHEKHLTERVNDTDYKLAVIAALTGLVYREASQELEALKWYRQAEKRLLNLISREEAVHMLANLYNFIAISEQSLSNYTRSNESAALAEKYARLQGLSRNDKYYQPQNLLSRIPGLLMGYGEDFSVVGEGKNPFGFSPLRQYELSLGIRLRNKISTGENLEALKLLQKRGDTFKNRDGDVGFGQLGLLRNLNNSGILYREMGDRAEARNQFVNAIEYAVDIESHGDFTANLRNYFFLLFEELESNGNPVEHNLKLIERGTIFLEHLKEDYTDTFGHAPPPENINETQNPEQPDYSQSQRYKNYYDLLTIEAYLHFYNGYFLEKKAEDEESYQRAMQEIDRATALLKKITIFKPDDSQENLRLKINLGRFYESRGEVYLARDHYLELLDFAYEFKMIYEEWAIHQALASLYQTLFTFRNKQEYLELGLNHLNRALTIVTTRPELFYGNIQKAERFYDYAAAYFIRAKQPDRGADVLSQAWEHFLQSEYTRFDIAFPDQNYTRDFRRYRKELTKTNHFCQRERELILKRIAAHTARKECQLGLNSLNAHRQQLAHRQPDHSSFVQFSDKRGRPELSEQQMLLRFFLHQNVIYGWSFTMDSQQFKQLPVNDSPEKSLTRLLRSLLPASGPLRDAFVIGHDSIYQLPFEKIVNSLKTSIRTLSFVTRPNAELKGYLTDSENITALKNSRIFNLISLAELSRSTDTATERDIIEINLDDNDGRIPFNLHSQYWLSSERQDALFILNESESFDYRRDALLYESLSASGTGTYLNSRNKLDTLKVLAQRYFYNFPETRVWGISGYDQLRLRDSIRRRYSQLISSGHSAMENNNLRLALQSFNQASSMVLHNPTAALPLLDSIFPQNQLYFKQGRYKIGENIFQLTLKILKNNPTKTVQLYSLIIGELAQSNNVKLAEHYYNKLNQYLKGESITINQPIAAALFDVKLRLNRFEDYQTFNKIFYNSLPAVTLSNNFIEISRLLLNKTLFEEADKLMTRGKLKAKPQELLTRLKLESLIYSQKHFDNTEKIFSFAEQISELREFKTIIQSQDDIILNKLTALERSFYLTTLLSNPFVDKVQLRKKLSRLMEREVELSNFARGSYTALLSARYFLNHADFYSAYYFFNQHLEMAGQILLTPNIKTLEARSGLPLRVAGFKFGKSDSILPLTSITNLTENKKEMANPLLEESDKQIKRWRQAYKRSGARIHLKLYENLPLTFSDHDILAFNRFTSTIYFNSSRPTSELLTELSLAGAILKQRALMSARWKSAINSAFFLQEINTKRLNPTHKSQLQFKKSAEVIMAKLPLSQSFVALLDNDIAAYRIKLTPEGEIKTDEVSYSGRYLQQRLTEYNHLRQHNSNKSENFEQLAYFYRSLLGYTKDQLVYYWFERQHALAPIAINRGDRIFQILEPDRFAHNKPLNSDRIFSKKTSIRIIENRKPVAKDRTEWEKRVERMGRAALSFNNQPGARNEAIHLILSDHPDNLKQAPRARPDRPWFLNASDIWSNPDAQTNEFFYLTGKLVKRFQNPGIIMLHKNQTLAHPYFLKNYYSRTLPFRSISRRFTNSILLLQQQLPNNLSVYNYRLVTPTILKN